MVLILLILFVALCATRKSTENDERIGPAIHRWITHHIIILHGHRMCMCCVYVRWRVLCYRYGVGSIILSCVAHRIGEYWWSIGLIRKTRENRLFYMRIYTVWKLRGWLIQNAHRNRIIRRADGAPHSTCNFSGNVCVRGQNKFYMQKSDAAFIFYFINHIYIHFLYRFGIRGKENAYVRTQHSPLSTIHAHIQHSRCGIQKRSVV